MRNEALRVDCPYLAPGLLSSRDAGEQDDWQAVTICAHPLVTFTRTGGLTAEDCAGCEHNAWSEVAE